MPAELIRPTRVTQRTNPFLPAEFKGLASYYGFRQPFADSTLAFRIRRTSDSATLDVGFSSGYADINAAATFVGAGNGEIVTLYDGGSRNKNITLVNTTGPRLFTSGVLQRHNSRACWKFNGTSDVLAGLAPLTASDKGSILVGIGNIGGADRSIFHTWAESAANRRGFGVLTASTGVLQYAGTGAAGTFNIWRRSAQDTWRTVFGGTADLALAAASEMVPFFDGALTTSGFTQIFSDNLSGNWSNVTAAMGANWDGSTTPVGFTPASLDFAMIAPTVLTQSQMQQIGAFFGTGNLFLDGAVIGDSVTADFSGQIRVADYTYTAADSVKYSGIASLADPGDTIANQKTVWEAYPYKSNLRWVIVQIGLNDMNPATATATTIAAYQDLIDTINAGVPSSCRIIGATMTPAYNRWPAVSFDPALAQAKWVAVNDAIMGRGGSPITGLDARIESHTIAMSQDNAGNAALAAIYDTGDGIHPNAAGRAVNGAAWRTQLAAMGLV